MFLKQNTSGTILGLILQKVPESYSKLRKGKTSKTNDYVKF